MQSSQKRYGNRYERRDLGEREEKTRSDPRSTTNAPSACDTRVFNLRNRGPSFGAKQPNI
jgi:hypothetical protein